MRCPAEGMLAPTPSAMSGSSPIVTNSVVPMAKAPIASAAIARTAVRVGEVVGTAGVVATAGGALTAGAKTTPAAGIPAHRRPDGHHSRTAPRMPMLPAGPGRGLSWPSRDDVRYGRARSVRPNADGPPGRAGHGAGPAGPGG